MRTFGGRTAAAGVAGASAVVVIVARTSWMSAGSGSAAVRVWFPARMVTVR